MNQEIQRRFNNIFSNNSDYIEVRVQKLTQLFSEISDDVKKELVNQRGPNEISPLSFATINHYREIVEILLSVEGLDFDARDMSKRSALDHAAVYDEIEIADLLSLKCTDANHILGAAFLAARYQHQEMFKFLLNRCREMDFIIDDEFVIKALALSSGTEMIDVFKFLIETTNIDVNTQDHNGQTPLMHAIKNTRKPMIELILEYGGNRGINFKDNDGKTALMYAADCGKNFYDLLIGIDGIDINAADNNGVTVLMYACRFYQIVNHLLSFPQIDVLARDNNDKPALVYAIDHDSPRSFRSLLEESGVQNPALSLYRAIISKKDNIISAILKSETADGLIKDNYKKTALIHQASIGEKTIDQVKIEIDSMDYINIEDNRCALAYGVKNYILYHGQAEGNLYRDILHLLLQNSSEIDVNSKEFCDYGETILMKVARNNDLDMLIDLLRIKDVDINVKNNRGATLLMIGASYSNNATFDTILARGKNIDLNVQSNGHQYTALMLAIEKRNNYKIEKILQQNGLDLSLCNYYLNNALMAAANNKNETAAKLILSYSKELDLNSQNKEGNTALMLAVRRRCQTIIKDILSYSNDIDLNIKNQNGDTALIIAQPSEEITKILLSYTDKININTQNKDGDTALIIACKEGSKQNVELLLPYSQNIDLDLQNRWGDTALMTLLPRIDDARAAIFRMLVDQKANYGVRNNMNENIIDVGKRVLRNFKLANKQLMEDCMECIFDDLKDKNLAFAMGSNQRLGENVTTGWLREMYCEPALIKKICHNDRDL